MSEYNHNEDRSMIKLINWVKKNPVLTAGGHVQKIRKMSYEERRQSSSASTNDMIWILRYLALTGDLREVDGKYYCNYI